MTWRLGADRVRQIYLDCLFRDGEDTRNQVVAEGITLNVGFHPERLRKYTFEIIELLSELPDDFKQSSGGGQSILNAGKDQYGNQWAGSSSTIEQLFQLGIAIGRARFHSPRPLWKTFPQGQPFYLVLDG